MDKMREITSETTPTSIEQYAIAAKDVATARANRLPPKKTSVLKSIAQEAAFTVAVAGLLVALGCGNAKPAEFPRATATTVATATTTLPLQSQDAPDKPILTQEDTLKELREEAATMEAKYTEPLIEVGLKGANPRDFDWLEPVNFPDPNKITPQQWKDLSQKTYERLVAYAVAHPESAVILFNGKEWKGSKTRNAEDGAFYFPAKPGEIILATAELSPLIHTRGAPTPSGKDPRITTEEVMKQLRRIQGTENYANQTLLWTFANEDPKLKKGFAISSNARGINIEGLGPFIVIRTDGPTNAAKTIMEKPGMYKTSIQGGPTYQ